MKLNAINLIIWLCLVIMLGLNGCGGGGGDQKVVKTTPEISSLQYTPAALTVGTLTNINWQFDFSDTGSDISTGTYTVFNPSGVQVYTKTIDLTPYILGKNAGTQFGTTFNVTFLTVGTYTANIFVTDSAGASSNTLNATFTIVDSTPTALVAVDYVVGSGDKYITRDYQSRLDWLDVTLTSNQTYDEVRTGEWYAQGFRHATREELRQLFLHAGTPDDSFDTSITYPIETRMLIDLLGGTSTNSILGFCGTDFFGNSITISSHPIGAPFSALLGKINYIDLSNSAGVILGEAHFTGGQPFSNEASPDYGSFLVRPF